MADLQGRTLVVSGVEQGLGRRSALAAADADAAGGSRA